MHLNSIHLVNYRCYRDLTVEFRPGFNVVVGVNGSGKTSLLDGVCEALSGYLNQEGMSAKGAAPLALSNQSVVRQIVEIIGGRFRFEKCFPVNLFIETEGNGFKHQWKFSRASTSTVMRDERPKVVFSGGGHASSGLDLRTLQMENQELSLFAFYRANRYWPQNSSTDVQAAIERHARTDAYVLWWDASLSASALQTWVIGKCLERFQTSSETGAAFDSIEDDELAIVNHALALAVEDVKGLRYDLKQRSLLVEWQTHTGTPRDPTAFDNLSDGQRAVIGLVADIARRMCLLNPELGMAVTAQTPGVVLIDELDMHLHPRWQRTVTTGLKKAFPQIQFIVTSHSPQVLSELQPDEIILLRPDGVAHPQVSYGMDSSRVLEEIMGAYARPAEVERDLSALFSSLERNELAAARERLDALKQRAPGIAELAGAEALLRRKEILGR